MKTNRKAAKSTGTLLCLVLILVLCMAVSLSLLFGRVIPYTSAEFVNVHSLLPSSLTPGDVPSMNIQSDTYTSDDEIHHPEYHMESEDEIFKLSYDETGKVTVIGPEGNTDKLFAPGTSNIYQFTLANTGDVPLDYTMTMEAYFEGTDLWIPIKARVWDYTNKYLVGSADSKKDVLELNNVDESGELGAGKYAIYNLEWEWPFERDDDVYDTMLGDLAVDEDLELHVVIRTTAVHDAGKEYSDTGLVNPPHTGDDSQLILLCLLSGGSFAGLCIMAFALFKSNRKEKEAEE
ncbi:MAG: hypothetical protein J1E81_08835 [Eubacterium sp.]|nr:hypothetical protein [Eubacterium sp.]